MFIFSRLLFCLENIGEHFIFCLLYSKNQYELPRLSHKEILFYPLIFLTVLGLWFFLKEYGGNFRFKPRYDDLYLRR